MRIAVPKERAPGEARVALIPDSVKRLGGRKIGVLVAPSAGMGAGATDADYEAAGAVVGDGLTADDVIVKIQPPSPEEIAAWPEGVTVVSLLYPLTQAGAARTAAMSARKMTVLSLDAIPRTTLAQMMDVLSSQATVAGYRAVVLASEALPKMFPMLMTAAGTLSAARVLVLGAGVAGLQAIATARRLGAVVEAFDVRKVVKEQVESLGAKFIEVPGGEDAQTASGYAKEVSDEYKQKQALLIEAALARCDVCITTALIPGRPAPVLVTAQQMTSMRRGTVLVDLAAEQGGNCALTVPGERVVVNGVTIIGERNLPSQVAVHASQMFSRNMEKLFAHVAKDGTLKLDTADEITRGMLVARGGEIVNPKTAELVAGGAK